jgi:predicted Zn-dependent peptidase
VPTVHLELTVRTGGASDPKGRYGLASLTADMLDEGAGTRSALEIADAVDFVGANLSADAAVDATYVELHVPVARLGAALPIMADVVARPTFPAAELKRLREERLASLLEAQDDPDQLVQFAFPRVVFGKEHRYGSPAIGTVGSLGAIQVADLKAFHAAHYRPSNARLIVAGDVTAPTVVPALERAFSTWTGTPGATPVRLPDAPQLTERRVYLIDKPGAAQSQVRIGWIGVPRSTPDYFALRVLNTVLGEAFTSRLNTNLREVHGYAYGASSRFDRSKRGLFMPRGRPDRQNGRGAEGNSWSWPISTKAGRTRCGGEEPSRLQLPRNFETENAAANASRSRYPPPPADGFQIRPARGGRDADAEARGREVHPARCRGGDRRRS